MIRSSLITSNLSLWNMFITQEWLYDDHISSKRMCLNMKTRGSKKMKGVKKCTAFRHTNLNCSLCMEWLCLLHRKFRRQNAIRATHSVWLKHIHINKRETLLLPFFRERRETSPELQWCNKRQNSELLSVTVQQQTNWNQSGSCRELSAHHIFFWLMTFKVILTIYMFLLKQN